MRKLARGSFDLALSGIRYQTVFWFQLTIAVSHGDLFSKQSLFLLSAASLCGLYVQKIGIVDYERSARWQVIRFLHEFETCEFSRFFLDKVANKTFIREYIARAIGRSDPIQRKIEDSLRSLMNLPSLKVQLIMRTCLYQVTKGKGNIKPLPTSFMTVLGGYIFITERPENITGTQKFLLYHELGHLSGRSKYVAFRARMGALPFPLVLIWAAFQTSYHRLVELLPFAVLLLFLNEVLWKELRRGEAAFDEMESDVFALSELSVDDLKIVARKRDKVLVGYDGSLTHEQNTTREELFKTNLQIIRENDWSSHRIVWYAPYTHVPRPVWLCLFFTVIAAIRAVSPVDAPVVPITFFTVTLFLLYRYLRARSKTLEDWIQKLLRLGPTIPADVVSEWPKETRFEIFVARLLGNQFARQTINPRPT